MRCKCLLLGGVLFTLCSNLPARDAVTYPGMDLSGSGSSNSFSLAVNPVKLLFMGLVNLEIEYQFSPHFSVHLFTEYLLKEANHPDFIISLGPRLHSLSEDSDASGLYGGVNFGYVWTRNDPGASTFTVGGEGGYKWSFTDRYFLLPRGILTYPLGSPGVLPGFEALLGITL